MTPNGCFLRRQRRPLRPALHIRLDIDLDVFTAEAAHPTTAKTIAVIVSARSTRRQADG